jgi:hypothetical protein
MDFAPDSPAVTYYVWQGSHVVAEHNGSSGAVLVDHVYSGSRMLATVTSGSTSYILSDRLSIRLTMGSGGSVTGQQAHLPFGEDFAGSGTQDKHRFTSYERDSEVSMDYSSIDAMDSAPEDSTKQILSGRVLQQEQGEVALITLAINVLSRLLQFAFNYGKALVKATYHWWKADTECWRNYWSQGGKDKLTREPPPWAGLNP